MAPVFAAQRHETSSAAVAIAARDPATELR
jgi:hypothetical protein